jgi:hypothetical protein
VKIGLDWDGTFTLDPEFWGKFITMCKNHGHDVRIITLRTPEMADEYLTAIGHIIPVIYTSNKQKREHCDEIDWHPHIFIDDSPEFIVRRDVFQFINRFGGGECKTGEEKGKVVPLNER